IMNFVNAYVYIDVVYPNLYVRDDMIMVDFIGDVENIRLPEMTPQETVQLAKERASAKLQGIEVNGGDYLRYLIPDGDPLLNVYFGYELVNPSDSEYLNMDDYQILVLPVSTQKIVQIRLNLEYYD